MTPRHGCFAMIFNGLTLTFELLSYYHTQWKGLFVGTKEDIEKHRKENGDRVIMITRMNFINSASAIEFCMKETLKNFQNNPLASWFQQKLKKGKHVYLRSIVKKSNKMGIINNTELDFWTCILDVRNSLVHNNGIANKTELYNIDGIKVEFVQGQMITGQLDFFPKITDKSVDLYASWITKLI